MIRASDFLSRCYQTLRIPCDAPRSDAKVLKTIKTPPRRPAQNQSST